MKLEEVIENLKDAYEGCLIKYKNKEYRVLDIYWDIAFLVLRIVPRKPKFGITWIRDVGV
jgi:hypothetical protein